MTPVQIVIIVLAVAFAIFVIVALAKAIQIVPQTEARVVERLGRYNRTMEAGMHLLVPFIDRVRQSVDMREQVVSFPPQSVITSDNLNVEIDTVIYFQVTDAKAAVYEIANYIVGMQQLTVTTIRNVIGTMDLEQTLTSRDQINGQLRTVLDEATGKWGIRVGRVELKAIDPPLSVKDSMEKQMRAERDRRAAILTAEGVKQSQILTAEGEKQSAILKAEGEAQSAILKAEGEARAILQVFDAIHEGDADSKLLAYQYLQVLPEIAKTESNKVWFVPTEFTGALKSISAAFGQEEELEPLTKNPERGANRSTRITSALADPAEALRQAKQEVQDATSDATDAGTRSGRPFNPDAEKGQ
ncbi:SPFH/Band 7/PHB domain protein [Demequina sp. B12]|uniref:SPFH domain-containing protein n=1 Tax=Demequina sp. B12 TaxID=2992757 RepID=UPI00237AAFAF|nr:SPFH domain-containing protein [Demequina sp. B12]MDE0573217.1 SPFH/Band 7/PHB domain protein [Demequina sp. B12]